MMSNNNKEAQETNPAEQVWKDLIEMQYNVIFGVTETMLKASDAGQGMPNTNDFTSVLRMSRLVVLNNLRMLHQLHECAKEDAPLSKYLDVIKHYYSKTDLINPFEFEKNDEQR